MGAELFRREFEAGNVEAVLADFAEDIVVYHLGSIEPSTSRAYHDVLFPALRELFGEDFRFSAAVPVQAHGRRYTLLPWSTVIDGIEAEGVDFVREAEDGRVCELRLLVRPREAGEAIHMKMRGKIGRPQ